MSESASFHPEDLFEMTEWREAETVVVELSGELDFATAGAVQQRLAELRDAAQAVVLDLDRLTFMDSTGIRLVLTACQDAAESGWSFHVTHGSEPVRRLLRAAKVSDRLPYAERARS